MKKHFWKIEYSLTLIILFAFILFLIPISFNSKTATYISQWNRAYNDIDYMFTAMNAQADSDIVKGLKNAKTNERREFYMIQLVKPYLRLEEQNNLEKRYVQHFMNGNIVEHTNYYSFDNLYKSSENKIIGIKDIKNNDINEAGFMMLIDMNGLKGPNTWGKDIYGIDIYSDGRIKAIGYDWDIEKIRKDCSVKGTGVSCSHFYRIGGEFNEG